MAQNIELKIKLNDFADVLNIIKKNEVRKEAVLHQRDIYYKNDLGLLKLRIFDSNGELIFYQRDESAKDRVSNYQILDVEPIEAEQFFNSIYKIEVEVVKKRTLFIYKNTRIHLDEVELLGNFLELETVVNQSTEEGINEFNEVVKLLGLNLNNQIKSSYRTLLMER